MDSMTRPRPAAENTGLSWLLVPVGAVLAAYWGVHGFGFIFDDDNAIVGNPALRSGDWWGAAFGSYNSLSNRPVACLSLAIDQWMGLGPGGMHVTSLLLHLLNAVLVGLIARRLANGDGLTGAVTATVWGVHPLTVDAVAYLTQRSMLLMATFALVSFYSLLRTRTAPRPWRTICVVAAALALASKEESIGLPLLLVLADRAFVDGSWPAMRARLPFHLALAATWIVLAACVLGGPNNPTVGYATIPPATAWEWLLTETQCLWHYVLDVFWPDDLRGMYDYAVLRSVGPALLPGLILLAAFAITVRLCIRRPTTGFAGAVFFVLLAPTSSVLPIITEPCADRRMYLPLLAFVIPIAIGVRRRMKPRTLTLLAAIVTSALSWRTRDVAASYRSQTAFATHAYLANRCVNDSFLSGRILAAMSRVEHERGNVEAAHALVERAMRCEAPGRAERLVAANMLQEKGLPAQAERAFRSILRDYPDYADAMGNLAGLLNERAAHLPEPEAAPILAEAEELARRGLALASHSAELHNTLAVILSARGHPDQSLPLLLRALELRPEFDEALHNLGVAYLQLGQPQRALDAWAPLLRDQPNPTTRRLEAMARRMLERQR